MGEWPGRRRWLAAALGSGAVFVLAAGLPVPATAGQPGSPARLTAAGIRHPAAPGTRGPAAGSGLTLRAAGTGLAAAGAGQRSAGAGQRSAGSQDGRTGCSASFYHGDPRLGPAHLPGSGHLGDIVYGYHRLGGMSAHAFLGVFWNPGAGGGNGGWRYPPQDGYVLDVSHHPDLVVVRLTRGLRIDRFGPPTGTFLSPYGTPFAMRALPPQSLDGTPAVGCNYYAYQVSKRFEVDAGGVARWFRQPGYGYQYHLDARLIPHSPARISVNWLLSNGYLRPLAP